MNHQQLLKATGLGALVIVFGVVAQSSQATTTPLKYKFPTQISTATIGQTYRYVFCKPDPVKSKYCGSGTVKTTNPTGGVKPYTFTAGTGLPSGLVMGRNGTISGKPKSTTPTGLRHFTMCVKDHAGKKVCRSTSINVKKGVVTHLTVTISSTACTVTSADSTFRYVTQVGQGTATGPVGTTFHIYGITATNLTCDSWTISAQGIGKWACTRQSNQPAKTNWTSTDQKTLYQQTTTTLTVEGYCTSSKCTPPSSNDVYKQVSKTATCG